MTLTKLSLGFAAVLAAGSAQAVPTVINFAGMANGSDYGESGYSSLDVGILSITGTKEGDSAFAYLDRGTGGLGVCGNVADTGKQGNNGSNKCTSGAGDDNVTDNEALSFIFAEDVMITNIWFNNNHDGGFGRGDMITIDGMEYGAVTGLVGDGNAYATWEILAGDSFDISFFNEQFYVSGIEFDTVDAPEPATLALIAAGLIGFAGAGRRK